MKRKLILIYPKSQKIKLVHEIGLLCHELGRPICSTDLRRHFRVHPEKRPELLQRFGQVLIKAARPVPLPIPKIFAVGIFGNKAYYAPDSRGPWGELLEEHKLKEQLNQLIRLRMLDHAIYLLNTPYENLARCALAGWREEIEAILRRLQEWDSPINREGIEALKDSKDFAAKQYRKREPKLISRTQVKELLLREFNDRNPDTEKEVSLGRYLAMLRWPQSSLFSPRKAPMYWEKQVKTFAAARWPVGQEDPLLFKSLTLAFRYGKGIR